MPPHEVSHDLFHNHVPAEQKPALDRALRIGVGGPVGSGKTTLVGALCRLLRDEMSVVELTRGSGVTQGAISQHLKSLKQAGLVAERPEGRNVF